MIVFTPLWKKLREKNMTAQTLIVKHRISRRNIIRLRYNKPVSLLLVIKLCAILECNVNDIFLYIPDK